MNTGIERDENGTYHWTAAIDGEYDRKIIRIVFGAIGGLCVLFTVYALVKYPDMFLTTHVPDHAAFLPWGTGGCIGSRAASDASVAGPAAEV